MDLLGACASAHQDTGAPANPGYASVPNGRYVFGTDRTGNVTSTNLALRYRYRFLFAQADVLNVFNEDAIADPHKLIKRTRMREDDFAHCP